MHGWDRIGGGHAWGGIELGEGMHGVGQNRGRACMGWDRIRGGHAWGGTE